MSKPEGGSRARTRLLPRERRGLARPVAHFRADARRLLRGRTGRRRRMEDRPPRARSRLVKRKGPAATGPRSRVSGALRYVVFAQVPCPTAMALLMIRPRFIDPRAKASSARPRVWGPSRLIVHQHFAGRHACGKAGDVLDHASTPLQHDLRRKASLLSLRNLYVCLLSTGNRIRRTAHRSTVVDGRWQNADAPLC